MRINADYNPDANAATKQEAVIALRNATAILLRLEVLP